MTQHNQTMPHSAFEGQTPDEVYFGCGDHVPDELAARRPAARQQRAASNRSAACSACPRAAPLRDREAPNHAWHIDVSVLKLLDGTKAYAHAVIDNFSRRILAWTVAGHLDPLNTHAVLVQAARHLADLFRGSRRRRVALTSFGAL